MAMHDGHRSRMKGEFLARPDSFPNHKLLELLADPYIQSAGFIDSATHKIHNDKFICDNPVEHLTGLDTGRNTLCGLF